MDFVGQFPYQTTPSAAQKSRRHQKLDPNLPEIKGGIPDSVKRWLKTLELS